MNKISLYFHTIRYLKPIQILYQIRRKVCRNKSWKKRKGSGNLKMESRFWIGISSLDLDQEYLKRFRVERLKKESRVTLLHEGHVPDFNLWQVNDASHLWNFNLHYLEFLIPLATESEHGAEEKNGLSWKDMVESWMENSGADGMEPYTISLRIPNLLIQMNWMEQKGWKDETLKECLYESIYRQYQYLIANQEYHLLANHYFENLKTIVLCSLLFQEPKVFQRYFARLQKQLQEQILKDGVHFERSLMYHKIILEDILRICICLKHCGKTEEFYSLRQVVQNMLDAMYSLEKGMGKTPLFNDAGDNVAKSSGSLEKAAYELYGIQPVEKTEFDASGYYKLYSGKIAVLFDCGTLGPDYMSGHGHCDALSFELSVDNRPFFVNSGTYQYQGEHRSFFRSTRAHNTAMVDEREQSQLWGEHRAAKRIRDIKLKEDNGGYVGQYTSYSGDIHKRKIEFLQNGVFRITDTVKSASGRNVRCFFHLYPGLRYQKVSEKKIMVAGKDETVLAEVGVENNCGCEIHRADGLCRFASEFGKMEQKEVLELTGKIEAGIGRLVIQVRFLPDRKK